MRGAETTDDQIAALRAEVRDQYETQSNPYYATSRLWDDGLIEPEQTREILDRCLLTDAEMAAGAEAWKMFEDPFPKWFAGHDEG